MSSHLFVVDENDDNEDEMRMFQFRSKTPTQLITNGLY